MVFDSKQFKALANLPGWLTDSGSFLPISKSIELIGVHIDDALSFDEHISNTATSSYLTLRNIKVHVQCLSLWHVCEW